MSHNYEVDNIEPLVIAIQGECCNSYNSFHALSFQMHGSLFSTLM